MDQMCGIMIATLGRVFQAAYGRWHPTDTTPGSQHKALLLTLIRVRQSSLRSYITVDQHGNPGREYGSPQTDPHELAQRHWRPS